MNDNIIVKFVPAEDWWHSTKWELVEQYESINNEVVVPAGFVSDGASIPRVFRLFFSPTGQYFSAAIIHDYIIVYEKNWNLANAQFNAELKNLGIAAWRRHTLVWGVKVWGQVMKLFGLNSIHEL